MEANIKNYGDVAYIKLSRDFSIRNIRKIEELWEEALDSGLTIVAFDCSDLEFIDSSAIGTLVKFLNESHESDIRLAIINVNDPVKKIFQTAKLSQLFNILSKSEFEEKFLS